ncbi:MAG: ParB/RepB/Spo0J family partition protein [Actinomycetota bacterium]
MAARGPLDRVVTRRAGLGRGLGALLPPELDAGGDPGPLEVGLEDIVPNPNQPRRDFDEGSLAELAASIAALGLLQPLLVRPSEEGRYELIAGERRWRAARAGGLTHVPVMVVATDERGSLERALVENIHRADLNPIEEAAAYRQLIDDGGLTQEQLASRLGRSRTAITNSMRLLDLPVAVHDLVVRGRLSAGHARALLALNESPFQSRLAVRIAQEGVSVRDTEDLVRRYGEMSTSSGAAGRAAGDRPAAEAVDAQRLLSERLQARVRVTMGKNNKGRIAIEFTSEDELRRLLALLASSGRSPTVASPDR